MRPFRKLQLINPPLSPLYLESSRAGAYPPTNLIALATYLHSRQLDCEIEILDGEILSSDAIKARIDGDVVGFGVNTLNYSTTLDLAEFAKNKGAKVLLGSHFPTAMASSILKNRSFVDGVVIGDGEEALYSYLKGTKASDISNFAYRDNREIRINKRDSLPINSLPHLNFDFVELQPYFDNFKRSYCQKPFSRPFGIYSSKGCSWRKESGGCIYCGIQHTGWRTRKPELVWDEISNLVTSYDADFFWDVSDNITASKPWLKKFAQHKPQNITPAFHLYGRADQIDQEVADILSEINCYEIFLGAESGDEECLARANKGFHPNEILKAVRILSQNKINIVLSLLLGLPGETKESAEKTLQLAKAILDIAPVQEAFVNIVLPLPGSKVFQLILEHPILGHKYKDNDLFNLEELRRDWVNNFCNLSFDVAEEYRERILSLFPIKSSFGKPK